MTDHRPQRFNKHTNTWPIRGNNDSTSKQKSLLPVIGHVFVCLLNRCGLWMVMYLSASGIVVACDRSCICVLVESLFSTTTQIHDRSQATTIPLGEKYMTVHRPQRFNKHTNTWPITGHNDSTSTQIHDPCICVLVESLLPVIVHVFVCLLNRCSCYRSCICVLVESLWPVIGPQKYMTDNRPQRFH
jgi:type III secretory pathway component EscS